jgi:two-component system, OmpR family, sensor histidine kinase CiaH
MWRYTNILYTLIFAYVIAALLFWYNSLQKQNAKMLAKDKEIFMLTQQGKPNADVAYSQMLDRYNRKRIQYIGEGSFFLILLVIGGVIVYLTFRKKLQLSSQQQNFMLSVTHELKSPLAGIKLSLETLKKRKLNEEQTGKLLDNSVYETDRLNELCNNILLSTQLDGKQYMPKKSEWDIRDLLNQCVDNFINRYPNNIFEKHIYINNGLYMGDHFLMSMIINNLIENAYKYAGKYGAIIIDAYESGADFVIQVIDNGPGIAATEKKKIWQKFYRTGNEHTRNTKGTGLGLHIVKRAIEYHGGNISMEDNKPKGNIAIIVIPKKYE